MIGVCATVSLMNATVTVSEVGEILGIEREAADGLVKTLLALGLAKERGTRQVARGRSPKVYVVEEKAAEGLAKAVAKLPR